MYVHETIPIDADYETTKQERLTERWKNLRPDESLPPSPLETRQWDFKMGIKNPFFKALPEKQRRQVILELPPEKNKDRQCNAITKGRQGQAFQWNRITLYKIQ